MPVRCSQCRTEIKLGEAHAHQSQVLCEECWMDVRATRTRKTHWLYLKSVKTEYLIPSKKEKL